MACILCFGSQPAKSITLPLERAEHTQSAPDELAPHRLRILAQVAQVVQQLIHTPNIPSRDPK
jgi:hypothetical protein